MKKIFTAFIFCFSITACFSQAGMWTWIHGDSLPNQPGYFGVQGVPSPLNKPPALYEPCEWTDLDGNFWLFGGKFNSGPGTSIYGDLWKYNPLSNDWTWMKGTSVPNDTGNYGIQGVPAASNLPPSRSWGAGTWTDLNGDLWLYGGVSTTANPNLGCGRADLWKYNIASNMWTWMHGSPGCVTPVYYVAVGVPSPLNTPGSCAEFSATWVDSTNHLWMFGGRAASDLWKYDISTNEWTMVKGDTAQFQPGVYGIKGIADPANLPGGRSAYCSWKDKNEKFWLFGGYNVLAGSVFSDMWMYDPSTNNWTWMSGSNTANDSATSGAYCTASSNFYPASRFENRARWTDACGKLWMYGGSHTNDLWYFDPVTLEWSLVNGHPTNYFFHPPVYGPIGIPSPLNQPGSRAGSVGWTSNTGEFYHFGGTSVLEYENDLLKYVPDTNCGGCNLSTSIQENNSSNHLLIFPNPASNELTISNFQFQPNNEIIITDVLGKIIFSKKITAPALEVKIQTANFSNGIYFIHLKTKELFLNNKLVVQH